MSTKTQPLVTMLAIASIILLINTSMVTADVVFTEDFTEPSPDWLFYGVANSEGVQHNWTIQDGRLGSFGTFHSNGWNFGCHKTESSMGPWSFDVRIGEPTPGESSRAFSFRVSRFPSASATTGYESEPPNFQVVHGHDNGMSLGQLTVFGNYITLDNVPISVENRPGLRHILIERDGLDVTVTVNGTQTLSAALLEESIAEYNAVCMWTKTGSNSSIDNIKVGTEPTPSSQAPLYFALTGGAIIALVGGSYGGYRVKKNRNIKKVKQRVINRQIIKSTGKEFNLSNNAMISLVSGLYRIDQQYTDENFQKMIPQELLTYRYLMHPTRLTIMKLLANQQKMKSIEIRYLLDISWGEYSNHIKSLEEKGYVQLLDEFTEEGHVVQVVYVTHEGTKEFLHLFDLLQQFVSSLSPLGEILNEDSSGLSEFYPKS